MHTPCTVSNVSKSNSNKMARAFAEGVIISIIGLERCGFKQNPVKVRVRVCIWDSNPNRLGYAYGIGLGLGLVD